MFFILKQEGDYDGKCTKNRGQSHKRASFIRQRQCAEPAPQKTHRSSEHAAEQGNASGHTQRLAYDWRMGVRPCFRRNFGALIYPVLCGRGWLKAKEGVETLIKERELDVNLLMVAAAMGAASIGYWNEGAMLIFIFALSGALESYTMERSRKDISSLMALKPEMALRIEDGRMALVSIDELKVSDLILVKPGELIPADGIIQKGSSAVNQASIAGESVPVDKAEGDEVFAGTLNGEGVLYIEVTQTSDATVFAKIIRLVEEAENEVPQSERFMQRFEGIYARIVVAATLVIIFGAPFVLGWSFGMSFYKAMVFLVVASPCALVASIMPLCCRRSPTGPAAASCSKAERTWKTWR